MSGRRRHPRSLPALLGGMALAAACLAPSRSNAGPRPDAKADAHLHFRRTYAEALLEARARNVPVFVSRHKDD